MIIWGSKGREVEIGAGSFHCPECGSQQGYKHKRAGRYFTLYFVPLFQMENLGEFVECQGCRTNFKTEVLSYKPPSGLALLLVQVRAELESGTPIQMARQKLVNAGMPEDAATDLVTAAGGGDPKVCPGCRFGFVRSVRKCSHCGHDL